MRYTEGEPAEADSPAVSDAVVGFAKQRLWLWLLGLIGGPAIFVFLLLLAVFAIAAMAMGSLPGSGVGSPSAYAQKVIPADMLALYQSDAVKQECPGLSWTIVAAIVHLESADGRNPSTSSAGAMGPSQFELTTWDAQGRKVIAFKDVNGNPKPFGRVPDGQGYALDGNGDGIANIMDPGDSVPATARFLCANGGGNPATLIQAIHAYNHAWWYVFGGVADNGSMFEGVLPLSQRLTAEMTAPVTGVSNGVVIIEPGANLPGLPITPETTAYLSEVAGIYGKPLIVTTGTNHSLLTVDGLVSDHASGHAGDIGMAANGGTIDGPVGDAIATACLIAAGDPPGVAAQEAALGGLYTRENAGLRIQCIWKTDQGGDHHNHVHIGARPG